jgi:hypothetical protein
MYNIFKIIFLIQLYPHKYNFRNDQTNKSTPKNINK